MMLIYLAILVSTSYMNPCVYKDFTFSQMFPLECLTVALLILKMAKKQCRQYHRIGLKMASCVGQDKYPHKDRVTKTEPNHKIIGTVSKNTMF